jgi:oligoendopeptidase F
MSSLRPESRLETPRDTLLKSLGSARSRKQVSTTSPAFTRNFTSKIQISVLLYDQDRESRETAFEERDVGLSTSFKEEIAQMLKERKHSKLIMYLFQIFECDSVMN